MVSLTMQTDGSGFNKSGGHLQITSVKLLLRSIQFHARDEATGSLNGDSLDFHTQSLVAVLNMDGTPTTLAVEEIPTGRYHRLSFRVHKPEDTEIPPDPDFRIGSSGNDRFSVIVEGTIAGEAFTYRSTKSMQQRLNFAEDLVISDSTSNALVVPLTVDISSWFVDDDGVDLDPRSGKESDIDKSIRDSFRARN